MPDCPAFGQSSNGLMKESVHYRNKGPISGTGMHRYRTAMNDAGMPMSAESPSMPMPSYWLEDCPILSLLRECNEQYFTV